LHQNDTIIALATPSGAGAIAVIRLSGPKSIPMVDACFKSIHAKTLESQNTHTIHLGHLLEGSRVIDEVLVSLFRNPQSYTGEDVVEISCHGSLYIQQEIIQLFIRQGCRSAQPGEFTLRAFLNAKIDLSQAEAVADLIASESQAAHEVAMKQMRGGFSSEIEKLRQKLIDFTALIELELDFSEEDVEFANRTELEKLLIDLQSKLKILADSFAYGNVLKEGVPVAIAGKPNAGKSSLLNALFNEEKAIVSDIAGTTRDAIEDTLVNNGIKYRFIDTAGLRETSDKIESIGINRAKEKIANAKILLYLFDRKDSTPEEVIEAVKSLHHDQLTILLVETKIDQYGGFFENDFNTQVMTELRGTYTDTLTAISCFEEASIKSLKGQLEWEVNEMKNSSSVVVTNSRHYDAMIRAISAIQSVQQGLNTNLSGDLLALDLKDALLALSEITGAIEVDKDILGTIFGKFCIGK
jgi:tRNA modification GTPase